MQLTVITTGKTAQTKTQVSDALFAVETSPKLLSQAIRVYLSRLRQGTSKVKTRAEINRSKKKWFKQKGTGNARHGARTPNIFVGGGVSHGPNGEQNWSLALTDRTKLQALSAALTAQAAHCVIVEGVTDQTEAKILRQIISQFQAEEEQVLVITAASDLELVRKVRNMANVHITNADQVTALNIVSSHKIILIDGAISRLEKRIAGENPVAVIAKAEKSAAPSKVIEAAPVKKAAKVTKPTAAKAPKAAAVAKKVTPKTKKTTK